MNRIKLVIDISEYNREWINNGYRIPQEINPDITRAIVDGEVLEPERKKGKWRTVTKKSNLFDAYRCSECNGLVYGKTNFCPYCGCEMER